MKEENSSKSFLTPTSNGVIIFIKALPKASLNKIMAIEDRWVKIRIKAFPEKGKANKELIKFLSKTFEIPISQIEILSGATGSLKKILLKNFSQEAILSKLKSLNILCEK